MVKFEHPNNFPNISAFDIRVDIEKREPSTVETLTLNATHGDSRFYVDAVFGYSRITSHNPHLSVFESDIFEIEHIKASNGKGLGSVALTLALQEAKKKDFHNAHMTLISSRAFHMVEKLHRLNYITSRHYMPLHPSDEIRFLPSTDTILCDSVSPQEAIKHLDLVAGERVTRDLLGEEQQISVGALECVLKF